MRRLSSVFKAIFASTLCLLSLAFTSLAQTPLHQPKNSDHVQSLTIFAAASLTEVLPKVAAAWKKSHNSHITFNFDASSRLAKQISMGAPADAFFSADEDWMDYLAKSNLLHDGSRTNLLGNTLVAIIPATKSKEAFDFNKVKKIGLAGEQVPAGKYAQAALSAETYWPSIKEKIVRGDNVRTVLAWTASGNVDAGIVYLSDALSAKGKVYIEHTFANTSHPKIIYPAAVTKKSKSVKEALAFLAFCKTSEASAIFKDAGFNIAMDQIQ